MDGVCVPCMLGYYYNTTEPVEARRCVACPPGFYCPSQDQFIECPGTVIFRNPQYTTVPTTLPGTAILQDSVQKKYVTVPTTLPGAHRMDQCNCSIAGGFEASEYSQALFGCVPCPDGWFSAPGDANGCQKCPSGSYASQATNMVDYRKCYTADSPRLVFGNLFSEPSLPCSPAFTPEKISAGATSCTQCPFGRPYTSAASAAKSADDCRRCPENHFFNHQRFVCQPCSDACQTPDFYESAPCTEDADRQCSLCDSNSCDLANGEFLDLQNGCPGAIDAHRPCSPCTNKPALNSVYVQPSNEALNSGVQCTWQCEWGYFARPGETKDNECQPCTQFTSNNCGPGFKLRPCSSLDNMDASCSEPCDPEEYGKPPGGNETNSEWVWTTYSPEGTVVKNPSGGTDGLPNVGCMWRCKDGYVKRTIVEGAVYVCARQFEIFSV